MLTVRKALSLYYCLKLWFGLIDRLVGFSLLNVKCVPLVATAKPHYAKISRYKNSKAASVVAL